MRLVTLMQWKTQVQLSTLPPPPARPTLGGGQRSGCGSLCCQDGLLGLAGGLVPETEGGRTPEPLCARVF